MRKLLCIQYTFVLLALLSNDVEANFATKIIPDHIHKKFPMMDPNYVHVPKHDIKVEDYDPPLRDPHKKKSWVEVPREPAHTIHEEDMHPDDHKQHEVHYDAAYTAHHQSIKKRERMDREERERERARLGDDFAGHEGRPDQEEAYDHSKIPKPKAVPLKEDLHSMIISVFIREDYRGVDDDNQHSMNHNEEEWMQSHVFSIETELNDHHINYQEIIMPNHEHGIQILCNDPEEREHIKHILIRLQTVLAFFMDGKMVFSKFVTEGEKEYFKGGREWARRERKKAQ